MKTIAQRATAVAHNPESNMKLASGVAPVPGLISQGIPVGLGTDGCASNNNLDLFEAMDVTAKLHKVHQLDPTTADANSVLHMATMNGARALGLDKDIGSLEVGKSADLDVGEWVLAIGSPFGFDHSVTAGIVSAKGRSLQRENSYVSFIQTDVAINPGNSGGPLFNLDGEVVGVNSQIFSRTGGFMGLSFAIPIELAMNVVDQLRTKGRVSRGYLGVFIQDVDRNLAAHQLAQALAERQPQSGAAVFAGAGGIDLGKRPE